MRPWTWPLFALVWIGCGNYSNDDIEFFNALPHTSDLTSKVPQPNTAQSGLSGSDAGTTPTCGNQLGQTSCFYTQTLASSSQFNQGLYDLLGVIDDIAQLPPTTRTEFTRTWGPTPNSGQPGFDVEVVMVKTPPNQYDWAIQFQPLGAVSDAPWFQFVSGQFTATGGARIGQGSVKVDGAGAVALGLPVNDIGSAELDGMYMTNQEPIRVSFAAFDEDGGQELLLGYTSEELVNDAGVPASGALNFVFVDPDAGADAGPNTLQLHSAWTSSGAGVGSARVVQGAYAGLTAIQCWGASPGFPIVYAAANWDPGATVGDAGLCADAGGL
jgi:hypothetical protein